MKSKLVYFLSILHRSNQLQATSSDDILEHHAFVANVSTALKNPLVIATREFLLRRKEEIKNALPINNGSDDGSVVDSFDVVISLSGGTFCNMVVQ